MKSHQFKNGKEINSEEDLNYLAQSDIAYKEHKKDYKVKQKIHMNQLPNRVKTAAAYDVVDNQELKMIIEETQRNYLEE